MDEDSIITTPETEADVAAENAAFEASFAETRGEEAPQPEAPAVEEQPAAWTLGGSAVHRATETYDRQLWDEINV